MAPGEHSVTTKEEQDQRRTLTTLASINSGKQSQPFHRNHLPLNTKSSFSHRKARDDRLREMKSRERDLKQDVAGARQEHTHKILERRKLREEKERLEQVKSKADERRRKKQKKREGRSGKINQ
ncbi:hypothetical protein E3P77_02854 [Wallemia ichthyophaga]|nr:hypothetical protein E3P97_03115 [Wallemia ichthyophaga]TIB30202.1 hypothetical protein E3P85_02810 [Wallemia ichthyophaga]TIB45168.1 hypothetical protein E3P82_03041 [Wallemia ichthyophaga]TIB48158.1 hypothetical protein E3P81_02981 [Wallemia ichthyophaga]TIB51237.1 hypothetical protein E3P80_03046 [Wallemia ichthyophaga]